MLLNILLSHSSDQRDVKLLEYLVPEKGHLPVHISLAELLPLFRSEGIHWAEVDYFLKEVELAEFSKITCKVVEIEHIAQTFK